MIDLGHHRNITSFTFFCVMTHKILNCHLLFSAYLLRTGELGISQIYLWNDVGSKKATWMLSAHVGSCCFKCRLFAEMISENWLIVGRQLPIGHGIGQIDLKICTCRRFIHNDNDTISHYDDLCLYYTLNRLEALANGIYTP